MQKYSDKPNKIFKYSKLALDKTALIKVEITDLTSKKSDIKIKSKTTNDEMKIIKLDIKIKFKKMMK